MQLRADFAGVRTRTALLFEGPSGWAEFAPFERHTDEHSSRWLAAAIEQAYRQWPNPRQSSVEVNAIVPELSPLDSAEWARAAVARGFKVIKLKVGIDGIDSDVQRVAAVSAVLGEAKLRLDANARWNLDAARINIPLLLNVTKNLDYFEQPVAQLRECGQLRAEFDVRIAVDESIRLTETELSMEELGNAADVAVLKAIPLGGVDTALELAARLPIPVVVSGSLDTSVGLAAGIALAATIENSAGPHGLATEDLFQTPLTNDFTANAGAVSVRRAVPSAEQIRKVAATAEVSAIWRERIARCYRVLEQK